MGSFIGVPASSCFEYEQGSSVQQFRQKLILVLGHMKDIDLRRHKAAFIFFSSI